MLVHFVIHLMGWSPGALPGSLVVLVHKHCKQTEDDPGDCFMDSSWNLKQS